jgi:hypothetical protein
MGSKDGQHSPREGSSTRLRDTRYLELHQGLWRVVVTAPRPSKERLKRSLGTASLREAQRRRWAVVAELKGGMQPVPTGWHAQDPDHHQAR